MTDPHTYDLSGRRRREDTEDVEAMTERSSPDIAGASGNPLGTHGIFRVVSDALHQRGKTLLSDDCWAIANALDDALRASLQPATPTAPDIVWLREVDAGTDSACWFICNKVDPDAVPFVPAPAADAVAGDAKAALISRLEAWQGTQGIGTNLLNDLMDAVAALRSDAAEPNRDQIAAIIDPTAWIIDSDGHCIEQQHGGESLEKADAILALIADAAGGEKQPLAWVATHPDRGLNFGTMAKTQQGASSRLMMTGLAGDHGWSIISLYSDAAGGVTGAATSRQPNAWRITDGEGDYEYLTEEPSEQSRAWSRRYGREWEPLYLGAAQAVGEPK